MWQDSVFIPKPHIHFATSHFWFQAESTTNRHLCVEKDPLWQEPGEGVQGGAGPLRISSILKLQMGSMKR